MTKLNWCRANAPSALANSTDEEILAAMSDAYERFGKLDGASLTAIDMAKRSLVDSIYKSANLEGLGTTFPKTEAILNNAPTASTAEEINFVINMKRAWQFLLDNIDYPISMMLLRELNKICLTNLSYNGGALRGVPVSIGGTSWIPPMPDAAYIRDKIEEIYAMNNSELKALKYFCFIARTQMFIDGNKRLAQLIANKVLIEDNIGIFQIDVIQTDRFIELLLNYYEIDNDNSIIQFMLNNCIKRI